MKGGVAADTQSIRTQRKWKREKRELGVGSINNYREINEHCAVCKN